MAAITGRQLRVEVLSSIVRERFQMMLGYVRDTFSVPRNTLSKNKDLHSFGV